MKIKRMLVLILITIFIMPTSAFANTRNNNIRVSFNEININVNGVNFESDNMVYDNNIYLPISNLSKLLNLSVHYYEPTNTIYIGQMPAGSVGESCKLYEEPKDLIPKGVNDIDVKFNNVNIELHGEIINSSNISYRNTTVVSLKSVCKILGMSIGYYSPTSTVYIVNPVDQNQVTYDNYKSEFLDKQKKLYVEPGTGDMQGWQKIKGHEYEDIVEIHYKLNGNMKTVEVKDIRNIDLNKVVEWVDDNGIKRYNSVGYIYQMFNHFSSYSTEWCYNKFGNLYMDWLKVHSVDGERIVSKYLETQS